jgi:hypothetical protein
MYIIGIYIKYICHLTNLHVFRMNVIAYIKLNITDIRRRNKTYVTFKSDFVKIGSTTYKLTAAHKPVAWQSHKPTLFPKDIVTVGPRIQIG